ncbi:AP-2 complex subunit mu [[Candida] railenensis]|uniref:AP-2 complex subunit mu n=1 Tax=[Candida] railenensis TaxID=45579 RepID=A0A9P0QMK5_9ASCO|nr:AP-2 complex subunit mu [[Candida] railenensis]
MITALFVFDPKGDVIMSKIYKAGVKRNISDVFRIQIITSNGNSRGTSDLRSPVLTLGSTSFVYIKSGQLWICAVTRSNQDCGAIMEFLYKLEQLLRTLLLPSSSASSITTSKSSQLAQLNEELITNNFNLVYEVLEEVVEFGYPTNLDLSYLKNYVTSVSSNDGLFKRSLSTDNSKIKEYTKDKFNSITSSSSSVAPTSVPSHVTWRPNGIKYRRNEIFLNVEESVNVLMSSQTEILKAYVHGAIKMKTHLSGMPDCRIGLSDDGIILNNNRQHDQDLIGFDDDMDSVNGTSTKLEDSKFHQCVELDKFDSERVIQFIPPDGEFQLMSYQALHNLNLPFVVSPQIFETGDRKLSYKITIKSLYPSKISARDVSITIPTPKGVVKNSTSASSGKAKFHSEENQVVWKFNKLFGLQEQFLTGEVELANESNIVSWARPPIKLNFNIDMFSSSGLTVKFLKVEEKSNYRTVKWVKYSTRAGSYEIRY